MVQRVAIFGSAGQLGLELIAEFRRRGYEAAGFERSAVDITDESRVASAISEFRPALAINAAAYNQVDRAEKEAVEAFQVNALAVRNLALGCRKSGARLVHFSTDYVFDGAAGRPYREDDATRPLGAYAVSKVAGELYASAYLDNCLIIRTSGVFGPGGVATSRGNFVEMMLRMAARDQEIRVVDDHVASPTFAPGLASRAADLVERGARGVFHLGGGTPISWFDWARMIFDAAGVKARLSATNEREFPTAARRPKFSALSNAKAEGVGIAAMPGLEECIRAYLEARAEGGLKPAAS
jgi:dTDP-4-dehydrorhamnose reductase